MLMVPLSAFRTESAISSPIVLRCLWEDSMTLRQRFRWVFRMSLMLFILASVAFLSALTAMRFAIQGRTVMIPNLVGKPSNEAELMLQSRRIGIRVEDRVYSGLPADEVVRQSPPPNTTAKIGQLVHVVLSLGPQKATIPQLVDQSLRVARIELLETGMQVGEISSVFLPGAPDGTVLQQDPTSGTSDVMSSHVNLLVSVAPPPAAYVMPDLVDLPLNEAESKLNSAGLKVAKLVTLPAPGAPREVVVGQSPGRGQRVDVTTAISLQVAQ
jgi:eukaryotic-like serine/threonine-protein kinase